MIIVRSSSRVLKKKIIIIIIINFIIINSGIRLVNPRGYMGLNEYFLVLIISKVVTGIEIQFSCGKLVKNGKWKISEVSPSVYILSLQNDFRIIVP